MPGASDRSTEDVLGDVSPPKPSEVGAEPSIAAHPPKAGFIGVVVRTRTFESLQYRGYAFLWATVLLTSASFWSYKVAVGWLTYDLTRSPLLTSLALGIDSLPYLLLSPFAGVLSDTLDRRKLLVGVVAYNGVVTLAFAVIVLLDRTQPWHIFGYIFLTGVYAVIFDPARFSLIPNIVPRSSLVNAFALNSLAISSTRLAFPLLAGATIALVGPGPVFILAAAMLLAAAALAAAIRVGQDVRRRLRLARALTHVAEGARYVVREPVLMALALLGFVWVLVVPFTSGLMPVYASEVFGAGPTGLGLLVSATGVGSTVGTVVLASLGELEHKGRILVFSLGLLIVAMVGFSQSQSIVVALPMLIILGGGFAVFMTVSVASVHTIVPDHLRGRISALSAMTAGLFPVGSLFSGGIAQWLGAPLATLIGAGMMAVYATAVAMTFRQVWKFR